MGTHCNVAELRLERESSKELPTVRGCPKVPLINGRLTGSQTFEKILPRRTLESH